MTYLKQNRFKCSANDFSSMAAFIGLNLVLICDDQLRGKPRYSPRFINSFKGIDLFTCGSKPSDPYITDNLNALVC